VKFATDPAFTKTPNPALPDPRKKKAQDLMNAAENTPHAEYAHVKGGQAVPCPGATCPGAGDLTSDGIEFGTINVTVISSSPEEVAQQVSDQLSWLIQRATQPSALTIDLPEDLPEGIKVTPLAFRVARGAAAVKIGYTAGASGMRWVILSYEHEEGTEDDDRRNLMEPPFWHDLRKLLFDQPKDAINAAVKWLDSIDAWYSALAEARLVMGGTLEQAGVTLLPRPGW
jgi:hypothetical protein